MRVSVSLLLAATVKLIALSALLPEVALAEVQVLENLPAECSNESRTFVHVPPFKIGPTWVEKCGSLRASRDGGRKDVWFPTRVCVGNVISSVKCTEDNQDPGFNKVIIDSGNPTNFDCGQNPGTGWSCEDRKVIASCVYYPNGKERKNMQDFSAPTTHAFCVQNQPAAQTGNKAIKQSGKEK